MLSNADEERLRRYFACTPWFEHCKMLSDERDSLVQLTSQLRDALVRVENEKGITADRERWANPTGVCSVPLTLTRRPKLTTVWLCSAKFMALRWRSLIRQRKDRKVIDKLLSKVEEVRPAAYCLLALRGEVDATQPSR